MKTYSGTIVSALRSYKAGDQRDWELYLDAQTSLYNCSIHCSIGMKPFDMVLSIIPDALAIRQGPTLPSKAGPTAFKRCYLTCLSFLLPMTTKRLQDAQTPYRRDCDSQLWRPLPEYVVGEKILVKPESALRSKENLD